MTKHSSRCGHVSTSKQKAAIDRARQFAVSGQAKKDGLVRESFSLPREEARQTARQWLDRFPSAAYWSRVESWQQLKDDKISLTMVRLPTAD